MFYLCSALDLLALHDCSVPNCLCNDVVSPLSVRDVVLVASFRVAAAQPRQPQPCHHVGRKLFASSLPTPSMLEKPGSKRSRF